MAARARLEIPRGVEGLRAGAAVALPLEVMRSHAVAPALLFLASTAFAAEDPETPPATPSDEAHPGVSIGVRSGAAVAVSGQEFGPARDSMLAIPVWVDLGYRATPRLTIALYGSVAPVVAHECTSCTAADARLGLEAFWRLRKTPRGGPWIGGGAGFDLLLISEQMAFSGEGFLGGASGSSSNLGIELLQGQLGYDFTIGSVGRVGPFLALTADTIVGDVESGFSRHLRGWGTIGFGGAIDP